MHDSECFRLRGVLWKPVRSERLVRSAEIQVVLGVKRRYAAVRCLSR